MSDPTQTDIDAEKAARALAEIERGCYCGYWDGFKLFYPHPKCSCDDAEALRGGATRDGVEFVKRGDEGL